MGSKTRAPSLLLTCVFASILACGPSDQNHPPVADAGPDRQVVAGRLVVLNGSCTDPDPEDRVHLVYRWTLHEVPDGSSRTQADLGGADMPDAWLEPDRPGTYRFGLACRDPHQWGEEDEVRVTVGDPPENRPPTVSAGGDVEVELGTVVSLAGRAFDPDGDALVWEWTLSEVPAGSALSAADLASEAGGSVRLLPDVTGIYRVAVSVDDGRGGQAEDTTTVTVIPPGALSGSLTVTVVDARTLRPIEGAQVVIGDRLLDDLTDADGQVSFARGWLNEPVDVTAAGPGTVTWRHDGDRNTDDVTEPRWRMQTWTGVDRPSITLALEPTEGARAAGDVGRVWGSVPWQVFDTLPDIAQMYSIAGAEISGQLRMVLVAPVLPLDWLAEPSIQDVLAPALASSTTVDLPGNLTTDDAFMHDVAGLIGRYNGPRGEPPFSMFEFPMPSGPGHVVVLGGITTGDLGRLLSSLLRPISVGHLQSEFGHVLGSLSFTTLFVGVIAVDVPAGGRLDLSDALTDPGQWALFETVAHDFVRVREEACDDAGLCIDLDRVRLFPHHRVGLRTPALPPDPRIEAGVPDTAPFEVLCASGEGIPSRCDPPRMTTLEVPGDAGTRTPYAIDSIYLEVPRGDPRMPQGGLVLSGLRFSEALGEAEIHHDFAVPALEGGFDGLSYSVVSVAYRRFRLQRTNGKMLFREGWTTTSRRGLYPGMTGELASADPRPRLVHAAGALGIEVIFDVDDPTSEDPGIRRAHVMSADPLPGPSPAMLDGAVDVVPAGDGVDRRRLTLAEIDRVTPGGTPLPVVMPRWDVIFPPDATELSVPDLPEGLARPLSPGAEVWTRVVDERWAETFEYQRPDPARCHGAVTTDAWSWQLPD
jgi:hypothetical protein